jgi:hypothetical protein
MAKQMIPKIKSFLPPTLITVSSGTYMVAGSQWIKVPSSTAYASVKEAWIPDRDPIIPKRKSVEIKAFNVLSSNGKSSYEVKYENGQWSCECAGFGFRRKCKHIETAKSK